MTIIGEAYVKIKPDDTGFAQQVQTSTQKALGRVQKVVGVAAGALVGGAITQRVFQFGKTALGAFQAAEQSQLRLETAFLRFPDAVDINIEELKKLNEQLALKTTFDDDASAAASAQLFQYKLTASQIKELLPLVQDYAAFTGTDLVTAATNIGKATLGSGRAFQQIGEKFVDTGTQAGNLEQIFDVLGEKVKGTAEAIGETSAGQAAIAQNRFGELQETIGEKLVPVLEQLVPIFTKITDFLESLPGPLQTAILLFAGLAGPIAGVVTATVAMRGAIVATQAAAVTSAVVQTAATEGQVAAQVAAAAVYEARWGAAYAHTGVASQVSAGKQVAAQSTAAAGFARTAGFRLGRFAGGVTTVFTTAAAAIGAVELGVVAVGTAGVIAAHKITNAAIEAGNAHDESAKASQGTLSALFQEYRAGKISVEDYRRRVKQLIADENLGADERQELIEQLDRLEAHYRTLGEMPDITKTITIQKRIDTALQAGQVGTATSLNTGSAIAAGGQVVVKLDNRQVQTQRRRVRTLHG